MSDLVTRLRKTADEGLDEYGVHCDLEREAADEIERLRATKLPQRVRNIYVNWKGTALAIDPEDSSRTLVRYDNGEIRATLTSALTPE